MEITFEQLPKAMSQLFNELQEIKGLLLSQSNQANPTTKSERPLTIDEAAEFLRLSKPTIYSLVSQREIPCKKKGNRLYFFKDELTDWIEGGRKKTNAELSEEANTHRRRRA